MGACYPKLEYWRLARVPGGTKSYATGSAYSNGHMDWIQTGPIDRIDYALEGSKAYLLIVTTDGSKYWLNQTPSFEWLDRDKLNNLFWNEDLLGFVETIMNMHELAGEYGGG